MTLIIGSEEKLKVGEINYSLTDHNAKPHPYQMFRVMRESNRDEWLESHLARGGDPALARNTLDFICYYYEIQTN
jgi:hypothetical protein